MSSRTLSVFFYLLAFSQGASGSDTSRVKLSSGLRALLATSGSNASLTVLIDLGDQLDFDQFARRWADQRPPRRSQGLPVRQALGEIARRSDRDWIPLLKRLKKRGMIESWSRVTIVNRFIVTGRPAMVRALSRRADVSAITEEMRGEGALQSTQSTADNSSRFWPLTALQVPALREAGLDGTGVVVGLIDSGASNQHEQLRENFRGGTNSWFDPLHQSGSPIDTQLGHGTAVLSCAVGRTAQHDGLGVAPGARWIAAVGLDKQLYNNVILTAAADWMLNVGRPDVLIIPWRLPEPACDPSLRRMVNAWRAAGIVVVFAAGNSGPDPGTDVSPANYTKIFPGSATAFSVGAVGENLQIYEDSSRGPNRCGSEIFPQFVAPGADIPVAFPLGASLYRQVSGTSFAAGFAAGVVALLLQEFPDVAVDDIEQALRQTAVDLGPPGPDPVYGFGMPNVSRALEFLRAHLKSN
jgi:subtilisin family serine protease